MAYDPSFQYYYPIEEVVIGDGGSPYYVAVQNNLATASAIVLFGPGDTPVIEQAAPTTDVPTLPLTIESQAPFASASTNKNSSPIVLEIPQPLSGGDAGALILQYGADASTKAIDLNGTSNDYIALGTNPGNSTTIAQATGLLRVPNNVPCLLAQRNAATTGDNCLISSGPASASFGLGSAEFVQVGGIYIILAGLPVRFNEISTPSSSTSGPVAWGGNTAPYTGALNVVGAGGAIDMIAPAGTGTVNSQAFVMSNVMCAGRVTTTGGTATCNVPLATTGTSTIQNIMAVCRVVTAGTGDSVGDTWSTEAAGTCKNVGGTVSTLGGLTLNHVASDASLQNSTLTMGTSGTNCQITITVNVTSLALGTVDCSIQSEGLVN